MTYKDPMEEMLEAFGARESDEVTAFGTPEYEEWEKDNPAPNVGDHSRDFHYYVKEYEVL